MPDFPTDIPFARLLGCTLVAFDAGRAEVALALRPELGNSLEMGHGGVTMTLLDLAMAHAARSPNQPGHPQSLGIVTIEMKTSFMRPALGRLRALGQVLHRTSSMAFCEASVIDAQGALVAQASGTFKFVRARPAGGHASG